MKNNETLITAEGLEELKNELDYLKVTKRKEVSEKIKVKMPNMTKQKMSRQTLKQELQSLSKWLKMQKSLKPENKKELSA